MSVFLSLLAKCEELIPCCRDLVLFSFTYQCRIVPESCRCVENRCQIDLSVSVWLCICTIQDTIQHLVFQFVIEYIRDIRNRFFLQHCLCESTWLSQVVIYNVRYISILNCFCQVFVQFRRHLKFYFYSIMRLFKCFRDIFPDLSSVTTFERSNFQDCLF